jgi:hypothetical protein
VPTGGARYGRRDNGLSAARYGVVGDVDPRVGEHLLDVLASAGIAAYLQPASDLHPVTRTTTLPDRPTDRLFADSEQLHTAREYLFEVGTPADLGDAPDVDNSPDPEPDPEPHADVDADLDIEAAWASIVAGFDDEVDDPPLPDGHAEPSTARPVDARWVLGEPKRTDVDESSLLDALDIFGADLPGDDDEGFVPPAPPPVPRPSPSAVLGVLAVVGGLWVFFSPGLLPIDNSLALLIGFCSLVVGVGVLIWQLRPGDDDDDPDDGAVV